jgi:fatty-acid desaturase
MAQELSTTTLRLFSLPLLVISPLACNVVVHRCHGSRSFKFRCRFNLIVAFYDSLLVVVVVGE